MVKTVEAPPDMAPMIEAIEAKYEEFFKNDLKYHPEQGRIELIGDNVMFIGLRTLALSLKDELDSVLGEMGRDMLIYRLGQSFGRSEAERLLPKLGLDSPVERIAAGPIWAAYSGFVRVRLLPGSRPVEGDDYFLVYDHPNNFEAQLWKGDGRSADQNICYFNGGYSSGWCGVVAGVDLDAEEIMCEAAGDPVCRFIMFPSSRRDEYMERIDEFKAI